MNAKWTHFLLLGILLVFGVSLFLRAEENPTVVHIQRTMKALEESTAENPAHIRVLFYGQSITAQAWTQNIQNFLREKYPTVNFEFWNGAIGGYTADPLSRTALLDLYPWYPDLLFFHVYGPISKYEEIVRTTRERTTAEIILWTSHLGENDDPKAMLERDQRSKDIMGVAERNHCMVIDLNKKWVNYLVDNGIEPKALLNDTIHLNEEGCDLYADFIWEDIARIPGTSGEPEYAGTIQEFSADAPCVTQCENGDLELEFTGNRVTAVSDGSGDPGAEAEILLDGKPAAEYKELWRMTRTSLGPVWMPAINYIGSETLPVKEDWTLTPIEGSAKDGSLIVYKVTGSVTGDDGEGRSDKDFVSNSGRVVINESDFAVTGQFVYFKTEPKEDFKVTWGSVPMFADPLTAAPAGTYTLLVQNCSNEPHKLTVRPKDGKKIGIGKWIVNAPVK